MINTQTSDLRPQTSDLRPQTSDLRPQTLLAQHGLSAIPVWRWFLIYISAVVWVGDSKLTKTVTSSVVNI